MLAVLLAAATGACITQPPFIKTPAPLEALYEGYPLAAREKNVPGHVRVSCQIDVQGQAGDCKVVSEDPPGLDFGTAAVRVMHRMTYNPALKCGVAVPGAYEDGVVFELSKNVDQFPPPPTESIAQARRLVSILGIPSDIKINTISEWTRNMLGDGHYSEAQHQIAADIAETAWAQQEPGMLNYMAAEYARSKPELVQAELDIASTPQGRDILRNTMEFSFYALPNLMNGKGDAGLRAEFCRRSKACAQPARAP